MGGWYLAPALEVLRDEVNRRCPGRDRSSDGTIGDTAHQATKSDHNPNDRGSVNAIDIDADGVHMATILAAVERHPSAHYWIWQREIADADDGWRRRPYTGSNPHTAHAHVSIRQSVTAEQDRRPWGLLSEGDDMFEQGDRDVATATTWRALGILTGLPTISYKIDGKTRTETNALAAELRYIRTEQNAAKLRDEAILAHLVDDEDRDTVLARIDQRAAELQAAVDQVDEATVTRLGGQPVEDVARVLRELYTDRPDDLARLAELLAPTV